MPFTGSHPAAVLPLLRTPMPASGLVVGSIAPDLPYYLPLVEWSTHTATAVVTTDLLIGSLAWALWHSLLTRPALATAPAGLRARLAGRVRLGLRCRLSSPVQLAWALLALVVGAATHVAWDAFTHAGRWGTERLPALAAAWGPLPGYLWLQYASSVAGLLVLATWLVRWWRRTPATAPQPAAAPWAWPVLGCVGTSAGGAAALTASSPGSAAFAGATSGGGAVLIAAVGLALAWHAARRLR